ncbi:MAG TPA: DNRLRE domain-containing protein [Terriglobales bacterium]|nr:DNRLRE domain-containing protein [Terriglobales bacterium]
MTSKLQFRASFVVSFVALLAMGVSHAQITPNQDSFTNSAAATTNYGANALLEVDGTIATSYIQFNLASIPAGASVSQATLKLYVNAVTTAGSFNVDYVNGTWAESTITSSLAPALGGTIASGVAITAADKNQYILINVTPAVEAWLNGSEANDGLALVANSTFFASFDSKENTTTSHPPELDIVFASGGTITGVTTAAGSGLTGGGTSGALNLSLTNGCAANQVLEWNGSAWACAAVGTGTITGVTAGTDLTGGGTTGNVTLSLNTSALNSTYAQLGAANTFTGNQTINGNVAATGAINATTSFNIGGSQYVWGSPASQNAFFGLAGNSTTTGVGNTATGFLALSSNTSASSITAYGAYALASNTTGAANQAIGYQALESNTTGADNTAAGYQALAINSTGLYNTATGYQSLYANTTGQYNTATGGTALGGNTSGYFNTATGAFALENNTTGYSNTGHGVEALNANTTGNFNTANGASAIFANTTGSQNTVTGFQALFINQTASGNTADGYEALLNSTSCCNVADGDLALQFVTSGQANTGVGNHAGNTADLSYITGENNTFLGTGTAMSTGTLFNASAIGANAEVGASNTMVLGSVKGVNNQTVTVNVGIGTTTPDNNLTVNGSADKPGGGSWGTYSDGRLKTLDGTFNSGLSQILKINPVRYRYKADNAMGIRDTDQHIGVVAQEVQKAIPEAVTENNKGYLLVNNDPVIWAMVNAIKQQQQEIKSLRKRQAKLESALAQVKRERAETRLASAQVAP